MPTAGRSICSPPTHFPRLTYYKNDTCASAAPAASPMSWLEALPTRAWYRRYPIRAACASTRLDYSPRIENTTGSDGIRVLDTGDDGSRSAAIRTF